MGTPTTTTNIKPPRTGFFADIMAELKKVTWLTRREAIYLTGLVLVFSALAAAVLGGLDYLFSTLINKILLGG